MINLKDKPTTLYVAAPVLGIGILMGIGYIVYVLIQSFSTIKGIDIGSIFSVPIILFYLLQIIVYLVLGYFLLRGIYNWSTAAIVINVIISPLVLAIVMATITNQSAYIVDFSTTSGVGTLIFFLLTPLILGVIAYNDLHYRLPKIKRN